ncbi:MAG: heme ABC transporter ATP-binding protein [Dehalococcoidia bacterium]|nr:heme ABC transporter ATP-binding protein [Dehalococcoidia bacterium]
MTASTPARSAHALVEARGVAAKQRSHLVLEAVDLEVHAGEVVALVGPNGAGKSTLLHVLAGDLPATAGEVLVDGAPLRRWRRGDLARCRAVLPQQFDLAFPFTVAEVVRMARAPWAAHTTPAEDEAIVAEALREADAADLASREFTSLSGGERARVAFARLVAQRARLLLLDEPTAALDVHHQELLMQGVRRQVEGGAAAVVVMHDLGLAAAYADRVALLARGALVVVGPPSSVLRDTILTSVYQHELDVLPHPRTGTPVVVAARSPAASGQGDDRTEELRERLLVGSAKGESE